MNFAKVLPLLLHQPDEIITEVLCWLDFKDLLSLRVANRCLHNLVHDYEDAITHRYVRRVKARQQTIFIPPTIHGTSNGLVYAIELQHRVCATENLATFLSSTLTLEVNPESDSKTKIDLELWRKTKRALLSVHLWKALMLLETFLERLAPVFIDGDVCFSSLSNSEYEELRDVYQLDQQRIIEDMRLDPKQLSDMILAYDMIFQMLRLGAVGLEAQARIYPPQSLKEIIIFRGISSITCLLGRVFRRERYISFLDSGAQHIRTWKGRAPVKYTQQRVDTVHHLKTDGAILPPTGYYHQRPYECRNHFMHEQNIWQDAAFVVHQRMGHTEGALMVNKRIRDIIAEINDPSFKLDTWDTV